MSEVKTNKNEFPIFNSQEKYNEHKLKKLEGIIDNEILDYIESKQPYNSPDPYSNSLWLLHEINNADKHRLPKFVILKPSELTTEFKVEFIDKICEPKIIFNNEVLEDGLWFMKYKFSEPFKKFKDKSNFSIQGQIEIGDKHFSIKQLCNTLVQDVFEVINHLGRKI